MDILQKTISILEKFPLCDNCLGRQFALLGYDLENNKRGNALKLCLTLQANLNFLVNGSEAIKNLKILSSNGFSTVAKNTLKRYNKPIPKKSNPCFLCNDQFENIESLLKKILTQLSKYEFNTFLVGIELPVLIEEREDEFKGAFNITHSESIKHEFARLIGKFLESKLVKKAEYRKPDLMVIVNPFTHVSRLQINPLFIAGRYRKLVRTIPQSKWFCSACRGKGCDECDNTGKLYSESVEELLSHPLLLAAEGKKTAFHASGREDIDARMLGKGRPFVVEISRPKNRFLDLEKVKQEINCLAKNKVEVSDLYVVDRDYVRKLKKSESSKKDYRVLTSFEKEVSPSDLTSLAEKLSGCTIKQQTPLRVIHRRADLIRERYIYKLKVKKLSSKIIEIKLRCQGGLYVKELVSGDEGRTTPSVSELLNNPAKTLKLDVLNVILEDLGENK